LVVRRLNAILAQVAESLILGDTAISAIEQAPPRPRRFLGRGNTQHPPLTHCEISECNYTNIGARNAANRQLITAGRSSM
jgi:hypothetical protein